MSRRSVSGRLSLHRALIGLALPLCILLPAGDVLAQLKDAAGSKDHPMIKRFEGSAIIGYEFKKFNDFVVLLGPAKGKTDIKPESAPAIDEIAKFLKQDAKAIVYVVGHTDNVGGYEHNMGLSQRRAEAVVKELTTKHGIPATRLKAAGTGPLAPMAPNETEEGRAKNRRVELVQQ